MRRAVETIGATISAAMEGKKSAEVVKLKALVSSRTDDFTHAVTMMLVCSSSVDTKKLPLAAPWRVLEANYDEG
jgi:hypothetical protein